MADFVQTFRAVNTISPEYTKLAQQQKAMIGDLNVMKSSVEQLNVAMGRQLGIGELTEQQQKEALKRTLAMAESELKAAGSANQHSRATLDSALKLAMLNREKIEYVFLTAGANEKLDDETKKQMIAARLEAIRVVQKNQLNISIAETIAMLELQAIRQSEEVTGTQLVVGGKAEELVSRKGVTQAALEEALAKERSALSGMKDRMVTLQAAIDKGEYGAVTGIVEKELLKESIQLRQNNIQLLQNALSAQQAGAGHAAAAAGVASHTTAQKALTPFLARNHWFGVSMGGIMERAGQGARLSGFDIGFLTFQMGQLSIAAAVAVSSLNLVADRHDAVQQLSFAADNLGISWARASDRLQNAASHIANATANTRNEIMEIMASLGAVTGGLIHSEDELIQHTNLVLDVMRRLGRDMNVSTRIVARTMAGNLESLRENFPGLTAEIDRLRASGASLEEMADWGMEALTAQVGGASRAVSDAGRTVADLRNSIIEIAISIGTVAEPAFQLLAVALGGVADAIETLRPLLPALVAGFAGWKLAGTEVIAVMSGVSLQTAGWSVVTGLLTSGLFQFAAAVGAGALAVKGLEFAIQLFKRESPIEKFARLSQEVRDYGRFTRAAARQTEELGRHIDPVVESFIRAQREAALSEMARMVYNGTLSIEDFRQVLEDWGGDMEDVNEILWESSHAPWTIELRERLIAISTEIGETNDAFGTIKDVLRLLRPEFNATADEADAFGEVLTDLGLEATEARPHINDLFGVFQALRREMEVMAGIESLEMTRLTVEGDIQEWLSQFHSTEALDEALDVQRYESRLAELETQLGVRTAEMRERLRSLPSEDERREWVRSIVGNAEDIEETLDEYEQVITDREIAEYRDRLQRREDHRGELIEAAGREAENLREAAEEKMRLHREYRDQLHQFLAETRRADDEAEEVAWQRRLGRLDRYLALELLAIEENAERRQDLLDVVESAPDPKMSQWLQAQKAASEGWENAVMAGADSFKNMASSFGPVMDELLGMKGIMWWIEGLGQAAYAAANWMNPFAALQHAAAAASFFYAASQAGKHGGTQTARGGRGGGGSARRSRVERRRQTLEEAPDQSLRSPSGLVFAQYVDVRGAVGVDGRRVGLALLGALNRGARFRSGHRLDDMFTRNWRR